MCTLMEYICACISRNTVPPSYRLHAIYISCIMIECVTAIIIYFSQQMKLKYITDCVLAISLQTVVLIVGQFYDYGISRSRYHERVTYVQEED